MSRLLSHAMASAAGGKPQAAVRIAELLARLFRDPPDEALLASLASFDDGALDVTLAAAVRRVGIAARFSDLAACRAEHTRLFHDPRGALVLPWESTWTENPPRLMGRSHLDALRMYAQAGFRPRVENEPADHIALELGFVALLAERGNRALLEQFWSRHVVTWMPRLARRLRAVARVPLYAALADLLTTAVHPIRQRNTHEEVTAEAPARIR